MTYYDILFSFFIYGFLGWCTEVAYAAFKHSICCAYGGTGNRAFSQPDRHYVKGISVYLYDFNDRGLYDCVYIEPQDYF